MTRPRPSPVALRIRIGERVLDAVLAGEPCPLCKRPSGEHAAGCVVGVLIVSDPIVARMAAGAKERRGRG